MTGQAGIWGVGIGPGDPELLTLKALRIIQAADVIAYPAPDRGDSLVRRIAASHLPGGQREIVIRIPMLADRYPIMEIYDRAAADIAAEAEAGAKVAILCEGDPFFYGSFMYLYARLAERWPVQVVPGVNSLAACAAELGMPLAARNDVISVIPATLGEAELARRIAAAEVVVLIKVGRHLAKVKRVLRAADLLERARYIERATMAEQRIADLADLEDDAAPYFSMIIVRRDGDAVF